MNYDGSLVHIFKSFDTVLGDTVSTKMKQAESELRDRLRIASEQKRKQIDAISVEVTGRPDGAYRDEEITVARCFADALGYPTLDADLLMERTVSAVADAVELMRG